MNHNARVQPYVVLALLVSLFIPANVGAFAIFDFQFGNHIDTHQETFLFVKNNEPLLIRGNFYIFFAGGFDPVSGLPIARHPGSPGEECGVDVTCEVGWKIKAVPGEAKFLFHSGINGNDHPVWLVNRRQIPQPGGYTHFHWITSDSSDPRVTSVPPELPPFVPPECEAEMAGELEPDAVDVVCPGWFMQITAVQSFAFKHGNETVPVRFGRDNATHLNLLTNYAEIPESDITPTR